MSLQERAEAPSAATGGRPGFNSLLNSAMVMTGRNLRPLAIWMLPMLVVAALAEVLSYSAVFMATGSLAMSGFLTAAGMILDLLNTYVLGAFVTLGIVNSVLDHGAIRMRGLAWPGLDGRAWRMAGVGLLLTLLLAAGWVGSVLVVSLVSHSPVVLAVAFAVVLLAIIWIYIRLLPWPPAIARGRRLGPGGVWRLTAGHTIRLGGSLLLLALLMAFVGVVVFVAGGAIATGAIALSAGTSLAWVVTTLVVAAGVAGVAFLYVFGFGLFAIFTALV
ncbi:MAG: hypothetical protein RLP96_03775 [Alphaproteobacteria bacterium]